jgi:hypothetical protein
VPGPTRVRVSDMSLFMKKRLLGLNDWLEQFR